MKSLVFDTETTGLPKFTKKHDDPGQPHVVQLGMQLTDDAKREVLMSINLLIYAGKDSEPKAFEVHKKTPDLLRKFGVHPELAVHLFIVLANMVDRLVAHNIDFDEWMLKCECARLDLNYPTNITTFCTMKNSQRVGTHAGGKWPKLIEVYREMVNPKGFINAHDALADVNACREVFWALLDEQDGKQEKTKVTVSEDFDGNDFRDYDVDEIKVDRDASWLIVIDEEDFWFPKSQCTLSGDETVITVPNWLAQKKGIYEE